MKMNTLAISGLILTTAILAGCGSNEPIVQNQAAITSAKSMRAYFEESKGDFKALPPADQAAAMKVMNGTPADVQKMFDFMKTSNKTPVKQ